VFARYTRIGHKALKRENKKLNMQSGQCLQLY